jgi:nucleotide-binding universal stress UspA family protein
MEEYLELQPGRNKMLLRSILIATDGSDHSVRALEHAHSLVHGQSTRIAFIHVLSDEPILPQSLDETVEPEDPQVRGRRILSEACHILGVEEEEIVQTAARLDSDLIIVGSRGANGWKGALGSVSQAVIADAPCSVLVVKEHVHRSHGAG